MPEDWVVPKHRTKPVSSGDELAEEIENTDIGRSEVGVCWLTQASWLLKFRSKTVLVDPWWRDLYAGDRWGKLLGEFPMSPEELPHIDYVFCTHWHDDHICPDMLPRIAKLQPHTKFIVPLRSRKMLLDWGIPRGRIHSMRGNDSGELPGGLTFFAIPAAHEELDTDETGAHLYLGYLMHFDGMNVYHMGDSRPYPGWENYVRRAAKMLNFDVDGEPTIDVAMLCINGNDNLSHDEAVDFAVEMDVGLAIPMHYGMDPGNTVDPQIFVDEIEARGVDVEYMVPNPGELVILG